MAGVRNTAVPFLKQLDKRAQQVNSLLCVGLDPHPEFLAEGTAQAAYEFCRRIIDQTHDLACAFKPNSAFFEALGGAGFDALRDVIAYIRQVDPAIPVILDAKRGDIASTAEAYARAAFEYLGATAITLNPYLGADAIEPFLKYPGRGAFVLCRTSNESAAEVQELRVAGENLYHVMAQITLAGANADNVGLVMGATDIEALMRVRDYAHGVWFLLPGVGAQGGDLGMALYAGLRADGRGVLVNVSRSLYKAADTRQDALRMRDAINSERGLNRQPDRELARKEAFNKWARERLAQALSIYGCVKFGNFTLKSGQTSPIYFDLRRLVSYHEGLQVVAMALHRKLKTLQFTHIAGIPYAALPIATATSILGGYSLIYPRREAKDYGTKAQIEGVFAAGDTVVLIDDLATSGESKFEAIEKLTSAGLIVRDIVVVIDREQGARETLEAAGYRFHALITLTQLLDVLQMAGHLAADRRREVDTYLAAQRKV